MKKRIKSREAGGTFSSARKSKVQEFDGRGLGNALKEGNGVPGAGGEGSVHSMEEKEQSERERREVGKLWISRSKPEQLTRPAVWPAASTSASWWGVSK